MFGQPHFSQLNSLLNSRFDEQGVLVAVHRGTGLGTVVENTTPAVLAALRSGADMVEVDVVRSSDGEY
ncbi:glycerophosphodiester phosphodiesterase family protein, partial [Burkholderia sp. SIMBA_024]|uniref:glycerophosphodiester phosphodiesterase family protein n=1 Tax=Burkholderia sp. SIMBA_024 TaxID=3085768 RepID=UPI00397A1916